MFSELIVPVDTSDPEASHRSIDVAKANLDKETRIVLLHVVEPVPVFCDITDLQQKLESTVLAARGILDSLVRSERLPASTEVRIARGSVHRTIVQSITDPDRQAIVMASHNPKIKSAILGSVATHVVKHAPCSVLVVRCE